MSNDNLQSQIQLLQEQIFSIQHSGRYTEIEIDKKIGPLQLELDMLRSQMISQYVDDKIPRSVTYSDLVDESVVFSPEFYKELDQQMELIEDIPVVDPEILSDAPYRILIDDADQEIPFNKIFNKVNAK
jgi:hypothetical protein